MAVWDSYQVSTRLTVCFRLPDGIAEAEAAGDDVEHDDVIAARPPPQHDGEQADVGEGAAQHCGIPLDVVSKMADEDSADGAYSAVTR